MTVETHIYQVGDKIDKSFKWQGELVLNIERGVFGFVYEKVKYANKEMTNNLNRNWIEMLEIINTN